MERVSRALFRTLIFAAMDTTSGALARILHQLAQHPEVQEKLRQEIMDARRSKGDLPHDELVSLPYLDAVCRETLRLYVAHPPWHRLPANLCYHSFPPVTFVSRTCVERNLFR